VTSDVSPREENLKWCIYVISIECVNILGQLCLGDGVRINGTDVCIWIVP